MSRGRVCGFHNKPGGCRRGTQCNFAHVGPSGGGIVDQSSPQASSSRAGKGKGKAPDPKAAGVSSSSPSAPCPRDACRQFWDTGRCRFSGGCRYRHVRQASDGSVLPDDGESQNSGAASGSTSAETAAERLYPYLFPEALARLTSGTDIYFATESSETLSPNDVLGKIRMYLRDNYRFEKTFHVYSMMSLLSMASPRTPGWSPEDGQLLLMDISKDNGLVRLGDILAWSEVSLRAGSNPKILSFQRGYLPVLRYITSEYVIKSTISQSVNALYLVVLNNLEHFVTTVTKCIEDGFTFGSFRDPKLPGSVNGSQLFVVLVEVMFECLNRFKNAVAHYPPLAPFVFNLQEWSEKWLTNISQPGSTFENPFESADTAGREVLIDHLRNKIGRTVTIARRERDNVEKRTLPARERASAPHHFSREGIMAALLNSYEGPGEARLQGPRHDNDFVDINQIRIAPTNDELTCHIEPFLPANFYGAPHPLEDGTMERLLDIQFRLLREELTAPLRISVQHIIQDLEGPNDKRNILANLLKNRGGKYRGSGPDSILFAVYPVETFWSVVADRRGMSVGLNISSPPGQARHKDQKTRTTYWKRAGGKRLMQGGLVALIWKLGTKIDIHLGVISSSSTDIMESARLSQDLLALRVAFFDPEVELRILQVIKRPELDAGSTKILIEASVMFESVRPFLEALRVEPESIPFGRYLVHRPPNTQGPSIDPPAYARFPGFSFQLASLFDEHEGIRDLRLDVQDERSIEHSRTLLRERSRLDSSQADAVIDSLTREIALIQGPPGTGKSYTGIELIRVLIANKVRPILLIALTNHALDHLLSSVLEKKITSRIVRLGSRSADERISQYNLEKMEAAAGKTRLDQAFGRKFRELKIIEEDLQNLMKAFLRRDVHSKNIIRHLELQYPEEYELIMNDPPEWVKVLHTVMNQDDGEGAWHKVSSKKEEEMDDDTLYTFWCRGMDLDFLRPSPAKHEPADQKKRTKVAGNSYDALGSLVEQAEENANQGSDEENKESSSSDTIHPGTQGLKLSDFEDVEGFFAACGLDSVPMLPSTDRPVDDLLGMPDPWNCSLEERQRLHALWVIQVKENMERQEIEQFEKLREKHRIAQAAMQEGRDEARRILLQNVDIIGATTTGASKLTTLLKGVEPRVVLVEEAGQVLEAHILANLVPSVQHLICIGDPLQLRPTINNYALSMDNKRGGELYKFDMSLMERLSYDLPMSRIDVQRRMRPSISDLIRRPPLYPNLIDHDLVKKYDHVRGVAKDVFFFNHYHKENGEGDESASKYNMFEVEMIKDLVMYLLRQGCYSNDGDIVVLCAYLGQLARLRDALSSSVAVLIDERDQDALVQQENDGDENVKRIEPEVTIERVSVSKQVRIRTVDNYQGEEGEVVILSLVRNSGQPGIDGTKKASIGFLRSINRTNVALSRAKQGLYILGNAANLSASSPMWASIIDHLESVDALGDSFPVFCSQHPETIEQISEPGQLPRIAPDGGCMRPCSARLKCGHSCPYKCHSDDPHHHGVQCMQSCTRLCVRGHPCSKECSAPCGNCLFPITNVQLPCGHVKNQVPCYQLETLQDVFCAEMVRKKLPSCEHYANLRCSKNPADAVCGEMCSNVMNCCGKACASRCSDCQRLSKSRTDDPISPIARTQHARHPCQKTLYCGHRCENPCSIEHECTKACQSTCRQVCAHASCKEVCSIPCAPCQEPCTWNCAHHSCLVPCGSPCARLPCDKRCEQLLACGHQCPSVCGEDCSIQICPYCATTDERSQIVDMILWRKLEDIDPSMGTVDELVITLPGCRHFFTVETLDGHCQLSDYYHRHDDGSWSGLAIPPSDFQKPPSCPTCRHDITCPRYGRVFKRADLDILETNTASQMVQSLQSLTSRLNSVSKDEMKNALARHAIDNFAASDEPSQNQMEKAKKNRLRILTATRDGPAREVWLDAKYRLLHIFPDVDAQAWTRIVQPLLRAYRQAYAITDKRSSHVHAWEASFAALYQTAMNSALTNASQPWGNPASEHALLFAQQAIGQPKPSADSRYRVRAIAASVGIRFTMVDLAQNFLDELSERGRTVNDSHGWVPYIEFLLDTCLQDAESAIASARQSGSHRLATETAVFIARYYLKRFAFKIFKLKKMDIYSDSLSDLINDAENMTAEANEFERTTVSQHLAAQSSTIEEREWLEENFLSPMRHIKDEWAAIVHSLNNGTFYQPVTRDDYVSIVKAFNFGTVGHFYRCRNGHTYVITECGGAMERSRCPECSAPIGGGSHTLDQTNSRDRELERIAHEHGARNEIYWH